MTYGTNRPVDRAFASPEPLLDYIRLDSRNDVKVASLLQEHGVAFTMDEDGIAIHCCGECERIVDRVSVGQWLLVTQSARVIVVDDAPPTVVAAEWGTRYNASSTTPGQLANRGGERFARKMAAQFGRYQELVQCLHLSDGTVLPWQSTDDVRTDILEAKAG